MDIAQNSSRPSNNIFSTSIPQICPKIEKEGTFTKYFYEASVTLLQKPDKAPITKKKEKIIVQSLQ